MGVYLINRDIVPVYGCIYPVHQHKRIHLQCIDRIVIPPGCRILTYCKGGRDKKKRQQHEEKHNDNKEHPLQGKPLSAVVAVGG